MNLQPEYVPQALIVAVNGKCPGHKNDTSCIASERGVYKYFIGAGEVFIYTSLTSRSVFKYCYGLLRHQRSVSKLNTSPVPKTAIAVFKYTSPVPEKYLYTLLRSWRSIYIHRQQVIIKINIFM